MKLVLNGVLDNIKYFFLAICHLKPYYSYTVSGFQETF